MASLPLVGVEAVVQGMAAFTANANSVNAQLAAMGRASQALDRSSSGSFGNVANAFNRMSQSIANSNRAATASSQALTEAVVASEARIDAALEQASIAITASYEARTQAAIASSEAQQAALATLEAAQLASSVATRDQTTAYQVAAAQAIAANEAVAASAEARAAAEELAAAKSRAAASGRAVAGAGTNVPGTVAREDIAAQEALAAAEARVVAATEANEAAQERLVVANEQVRASNALFALSFEENIAAENAAAVAAAELTAATEAEAVAIATAAQAEAVAVEAAAAEMEAAYAAESVAAELAAAAQVEAAAEVEAAQAGVGLAAVGVAAVAGAAVAALGVAAIIVGEKFDSSLQFVKTIGQATGAEMDALSKRILELSRNTTVSTSALVTLATELVKAGFSVDQVDAAMLRTVNDMVLLSNGELSAADAATTLVVSMNAFHTTAVETADDITAAVQRSTLSYTDMAAATRQGGTVAAQAGLSFKQFTATVATASQEIKSGSVVGTGLAQMFLRLENPTKAATEIINTYKVGLFDANNATRPWIDTLSALESTYGKNAIALGKMTEQQRDHDLAVLFGTRSDKVALALIDQGTESYNRMLEATEKLTASQLADQMLKPTSAQLKIMGNDLRDVGIAFNAGLDPYINATVSSIVKFLGSLDLDKIREFGLVVGRDVYNAFANVGNVLNTQILPGFTTVDAALVLMTGGTSLFSKAWTQDWARVREITTAVIEAIVALFKWFTNLVIATGKLVVDIMIGMGRAVVTVATAVGGALGQAANVVATSFGSKMQAIVKGVIELFALLADAMPGVVKGASDVSNKWASIWASIANAVATAVNAIGQHLQGLLSFVGSAVGGVKSYIASLPGGDAILADVGAIANSFAFIPQFVSRAQTAITGFSGTVESTGASIRALAGNVNAAFAQLAKIKLPQLHDFAADVENAAALAKAKMDADLLAARAPRDKPLESPGGAPAGNYPTSGADKAAKKTAQDIANALKAAQDLIVSYNSDVEKEVESTTGKISDLWQKASDDMAKDTQKASQDSADAIKGAFDKITETQSQRDIKDDSEKRTKALDDELKEKDRIRAEGLANDEVTHQRALQDDRTFYDAQRKLREDAFDREQADKARRRDYAIQDADKIFTDAQQKRQTDLQNQQDAAALSLKAQQDADAALLKDQQEAAAASLKAQQDARDKALKIDQDARKAALQAQLDAAAIARQDQQSLDAINLKAQQDKTSAQNDYNEAIAKGVKQSIAQARFNDANKQIDKDTGKAKSDLADREKQAADDKAFQASQDAQMAALQKQFDVEQAAEDVRVADETLALKTKTEADTLALKEDYERRTTALHEQQERDRNALTETLYKETLQHQRDADTANLKFQKDQTDAKNAYVKSEDEKELKDQRSVEDAERIRKLKLDADDRQFKLDQDQKRRDLTKQLDDEEYNRRYTQTVTEMNKRLLEVQTTLDKEQEATRAKLAQDIVDLEGNLKERTDTIQREYLDKLNKILEDGGAALKPVVDEITNNIATGLQNIRDAAKEATDALAEAFAAADKLNVARDKAAAAQAASASQGGTGSAPNLSLVPGTQTSWTTYNADPANAGRARNPDGTVKTYANGGTVPGPYGMPQVVVAHGGEHFEGMSGAGTMLAAVRAAESMWGRGISQPASSVSQTSYTVNANYGRVQPEGTIRQDLSALVALTSGS